MLYLKEEFLTKDECCDLIKFYNHNILKTFKHRDTFPLKLINPDQNINLIVSKITSLCEQLSDLDIVLDNCEIVRWPCGSFQDSHYDGDDVFAVIVYLNDEYIGGETCFEFDGIIEVKPKIGKCLIFSNSKHLHWVQKIKLGTRYTLACWFIKS